MTVYFQVEHDFVNPKRWYLNGLRDNAGVRLDSRVCGYGLPVDLGPPFRLSAYSDGTVVEVDQPLHASLRKVGSPLDFTLADYDVPIITSKIGKLIAEIAPEDIQRIPVSVESRQEQYEILNVISRVACIDPKRSTIQWWTAEDGRPDKIGKPRMIVDLVIDPFFAAGHHLLRPEGWEVVLIVSDVIKRALEEVGTSGIGFRQVSEL